MVESQRGRRGSAVGCQCRTGCGSAWRLGGALESEPRGDGLWWGCAGITRVQTSPHCHGRLLPPPGGGGGMAAAMCGTSHAPGPVRDCAAGLARLVQPG